MPWWGIVIIFFATFIVFALLHFTAKNKRPFRRALLSMALGAGTLTAINLTAGFPAVYLPGTCFRNRRNTRSNSASCAESVFLALRINILKRVVDSLAVFGHEREHGFVDSNGVAEEVFLHQLCHLFVGSVERKGE